MRLRLTMTMVLSLAVIAAAARAEDPVEQLRGVDVIGVSPTDTTGVALDRYPANAQKVTAEQVEQAQARSLSEYLGRRSGSVFLSEAQSNPYQPDLFYRGYSISPLLGLPQGLALYIDGVRVNEVFGDVVNWDLIPDAAIDSLQLIPGSNPVFGQNTLAGALSLRTKSGFDAPGTRLELLGGSQGRAGLSAEHGASKGPLAFFVSGEYEHADGWRDFSPSRIGRLFAKGSYQDRTDSLDLAVSLADNRLTGNGAAPALLLRNEGRQAVFTQPDETRPQLGFANLQGNHIFSSAAQLSAGVYFRRDRSKTLNGDGTQFQDCTDPAHRDAQGNPYLCAPGRNGERVISDRDGASVLASSANDGATRNAGTTDQYSYGVRTQLTLTAPGLRRTRLILGGSADLGRARFGSETELAALRADRGIVGSGQYDADATVGLRTRKDLYSAFVVGNWAPLDRLDLTAAASLNRTEIRLRDENPDRALDGDHGYTRVNPSLGAAWHLSQPLSLFASYSESSRAPTPVELTCANPDDPCRLPNGFVSDPPLKQVVTHTVEAGLRYTGPALRAAAAFFNSDNKNDILFITDGALTTEGYFSNVGDTLRRGFELGGSYQFLPRWSAGLQYTYLDALFRQDFLVNSPNHPLRDPNDPAQSAAETRPVHSGNRIPLIPRHLAKADLEWRSERCGAGIEVQGRSNSRFRGDEANVDPQTLPGYAIFSVYGDWKPRPYLVLFARVTNLFDRDTETFGTYGDATRVLGAAYAGERRFVGPGAPREFSAGLRLQF
ncbi:MAG: TonB-dependent receptor [Nevskia sp.]